MGYEISVNIEYTCDKCGRTDWYDCNEPMSEDETATYIECQGWRWNGNLLLCDDCASKTEPEEKFLEKCMKCIRHINYLDDMHCPHYKRLCGDVFNQLYEELDDEGVPICPYYQPVGGIKSEGPKYAPTSASLEGFVEGLKKEAKE